MDPSFRRRLRFRQGTNLNLEAQKTLNGLLRDLEQELSADMLTLLGPIRDGVEFKVREALEGLDPRRPKLTVLLHTNGGLVELAERMVNITRHFYPEVVFLIPDVAMSAGTVFAMSGDAIMMDYFSCLGRSTPRSSERASLCLPSHTWFNMIG